MQENKEPDISGPESHPHSVVQSILLCQELQAFRAAKVRLSRAKWNQSHCTCKSDQAYPQLIMSQQALHDPSCGWHCSQGLVQEATNVKWVWVKQQVV